MILKHILVIRLSAMGDVAMTVPIIMALQQQHPNVKITYVSRPFFKPFFSEINNVSFFEVDLKARHNGFLGIFRLFFDLKKLKIDAVADLHNVLRSKILRFLFVLSGKKVAHTNKGRADKKALVRSKNKIFKPLKTMFNRHLETFSLLGFDINLEQLKFAEKAILTNNLKNVIRFDEKDILIGIAPFAQYKSKVYDADVMQKVIDDLALNTNYKMLLFGGGATEIEQLNDFAQNKNNAIVIAGKCNLAEELQLISNLKVMLSMDSANAHMAAMLGVKVITLWGATHPFAGFAPFNQPPDNCLVSDRKLYSMLPTSVYGNKIVPNYQAAMRTIAPKKVVEAIIAVLA